ncbi:MAG TPA: hypothetical protein VJU87_05435 [Gemmatimonadaceae bacterium]|nr:hypothetical protein [Gemmatimonadaceae bacterium]
MSFVERRGFERIEYTQGDRERPVFALDDHAFPVADCAERGLRYLPEPLAELPSPGSEIRGVVRFPGGREAFIEGVVVRAERSGVGVHFTEHWIDKEVIESERRRLRGPESYAG